MTTTMLFTITAGRTGTKYLYRLLQANLPDAHCYHERLTWNVHHPGPGVLTHFNHNGMTNEVKSFWALKMLLVHDEVGQAGARYYAETSHVLSKAGLVEALVGGPMYDRDYVIVMLRRDPLKTMLSYHNRHDFEGTKSSMWMWYLDWSYPRFRVSPREYVLQGKGDPGKLRWCQRLWYLDEMHARQTHYRERLRGMKHYKTVTVDLEKLNTEEGCRPLFKALGHEPDELQIPEPENVSGHVRKVPKKEMEWIGEMMEAMG